MTAALLRSIQHILVTSVFRQPTLFSFEVDLSLLGSEVTVPIKIVRDTGSYDLYIVFSVLPLSKETLVTQSWDGIEDSPCSFAQGGA